MEEGLGFDPARGSWNPDEKKGGFGPDPFPACLNTHEDSGPFIQEN